MEEGGLVTPMTPEGDKSEVAIAPQNGRDQVAEEGLLTNPDEPFVQLLRRYKLSEDAQVCSPAILTWTVHRPGP